MLLSLLTGTPASPASPGDPRGPPVPCKITGDTLPQDTHNAYDRVRDRGKGRKGMSRGGEGGRGGVEERDRGKGIVERWMGSMRG